MWSKIEDAIEDIRLGKMVVVLDDEDRENEGDLIMAAELIRKEDVNFMMNKGRGLICAPLSTDRCDFLELPDMHHHNTEAHSCAFTISVDVKKGTTTGISAGDRAKTIRALAAIDTAPNDFAKPGHIFPLRAQKGGTLVRAGHTEAAIDLVTLANLSPAAVICEIIKDNGDMARRDDLFEFAKNHDFKIITIKELIAYRQKNETLVTRVKEENLNTKHGDFRLFHYKNSINDQTHFLLIKGEPEWKEGIYVKAHSECKKGERFQLKSCHCQDNLKKAMQFLNQKGEGIILYIQNDREACHSHDNKTLREYGLGAQMLKDLGLHKIKLLHAPQKIVGLEAYGLEIEEFIPLHHKQSAKHASLSRHDLHTMDRLPL